LSSIFADCGIAGGQMYGKSDKVGAYVESNPVRPEELAATIFITRSIFRSTNRKTTAALTDSSPLANR